MGWFWSSSNESEQITRLKSIQDDLARLRRDIAVLRLEAVHTSEMLSAAMARLAHLDRPSRVVFIRVLSVGEQVMADLLDYQVLVPALVEANDVVLRKLSVSVAGGTPIESELVPGDSQITQDGVTYNAFPVFSAPQGAEVTVTAVDVDDAGNRSLATVYSFNAVDTIPPAAPSGLMVKPVSERTVSDADQPVVTPDEPTPG